MSQSSVGVTAGPVWQTGHEASDVDDEVAFSWESGKLHLLFNVSPDHPVVLNGLGADERSVAAGCSQPLVELMITGDGRARNNTRFTNTGVGHRLRHVRHASYDVDGEGRLDVVQLDAVSGLLVTTTFAAGRDIAGARVRTTVENQGGSPVVLEAVSSWATGAVIHHAESAHDLVLHVGYTEQLAENRWAQLPLWSQAGLADFNSALMSQPGRGGFTAVGTSTWSTAKILPTAAISNRTTGRAVAWQVEHNGAWRWEVDNVRVEEDSVAIVLLGPEDLDHQWSVRLDPGQSFVTVPISFAVSMDGFAGAIGELTRHRRWLRRANAADRGSVLVFNDYMNTINGDPTTERLLPLIAAAARAGAECFCIDAGWYDDTELGDWWPTVGEWIPSARRFPDGGLPRVADAVRAAGMKVGIWVEPEVVGVHSPIVERLPKDAFLQRHGLMVREHDRYFLDLRHPAAIQHLDSTFDRLIHDLGIGYFKLDYNVTPGAGTDAHAFSVGAGLLEHNRAHLAWLRRLRQRYPDVVFENGSSGAMRADFAMLELFDLQSTSDQEDYRLYSAIAAAAPAQMLPEQAGNWAYPQSWMSDEQIAYTMVTGLSGRLYLSGFLDRMSADQFQLVRSACDLFKAVRGDVARSVPDWPLGMPEWYGQNHALRLTGPDKTLLYIWHRGDADDAFDVELGEDITSAQLVQLYPTHQTRWSVRDHSAGVVRIHPGVAGPSARIYEIKSK